MTQELLFDTSALVDLVLDIAPPPLDVSVVFDHCLLELTMYEAGNALWKIAFAKDDLTDDELGEALSILDRLTREVSFEHPAEGSLQSVMRTARRTGSTFYDASYVTVADSHGLTLVTKDDPQRKAATAENVAVLSLAELAEEYD